jgi:hypothetical protein
MNRLKRRTHLVKCMLVVYDYLPGETSMAKARVRHRDSVDGRYVAKEEADKRPRETTRETDRPSLKKPPSPPKKK